MCHFRYIAASFKFADRKLIYSAMILRDGRIYAAGKKALCSTFQAPESIRGDTKLYADEIYSESDTSPVRSTKISPLDDEGLEHVSGFRIQGCAEYEYGIVNALIIAMTVALKKWRKS